MNQTSNLRFKSVYICAFAVFAIAAVAVPAIIYLDAQRITAITESDYTYINDVSFVCEIENTEQTDSTITLQGWFAQNGKKITHRNCCVVLKNLEDSSCFKLPTKAIKDSGAKTFFADGLNYYYAGFLSKVETKHLQNDNTYLVLILCENEGQMVLFDTEQTINLGQKTK